MRLKKFTALMLALAMVLALVPAVTVGAAFDIDDGLVLHYSFDSDSGQPDTITDDSGNGLHGTVVGAANSWAGVSGQLVVEGGVAVFPGFSGSGWWTQVGEAIKIPEALKEKIDGDYTVSMWVKPDSSYSLFKDGMQRFFDFGVDRYDSIFLRYVGGSDELRFQDRKLGNDENSYMAMTGWLYPDVWSLVTVTYSADDNTAILYVNDMDVIQGSVFSRSINSDLGALSNSTHGLYLGRTQWWDDGERDKNPDYCGQMDDVRIYNRTLSPHEVVALYRENYHDPDMKRIVSGLNPVIHCIQGGPLYLPNNIEVYLEDGTQTYADVIWDDVAQEQLNAVGSFGLFGEVHIGDYNYGKIAYATITVTSANSDLNNGLELYYSFEYDWSEPSEITDDSGNGLNGIVLGGQSSGWGGGSSRRLTIEQMGTGSVAHFPGGSRGGRNGYNNGPAIAIPEYITKKLEYGSFTVSMWVKPDGSYEYSDKMQRFFDFGSDKTRSVFLRYIASSGELRFQDRALGNGENSYISATNPINDKWSLVTVTKQDGGPVTVYVDGKELMSGAGFYDTVPHMGTPNGDYGYYLGRTQWWNQNEKADNPEYCGYMDEVRIYSRAITEEEVQELYLTTCPEPMVQINITHELVDGTIIETPTPVMVAEGSSYTYAAPAEIEYNGMVYGLSPELSTLTIKNVNSYNNKITAVYVVKEVSGYEEIFVEAYINTAPEMPERVALTYNTGEAGEAAAKWLDVPEAGWPEIGEYVVHGIAAGFEITATVSVYNVYRVDAPKIIYTNIGSWPELPASAVVTTSNWNEISSDLVWDEIPADKVESNEDFEISGYIAAFPDYKLTVTVKFMLIAVSSFEPLADTYISGEYHNENFGDSDQIFVSSVHGDGPAQYTRYGVLRFEKPDMSEMISAKVKVYLNEIHNGAETSFSLWGFQENGWDEYEITMNNMRIYSLYYAAETVYTPTEDKETVNGWIEFDITNFIERFGNLMENFNFRMDASTCAGYFSSREGAHPPVLEILSEGKEATVRYMLDGTEIKSKKIAVPKSGPYIYEAEQAFVMDGKLYVSEGKVEIPDTAEIDEIKIVVAETDYEVEEPVVNAYVDEIPTMPSTVKIVWDGGKLEVPAEFDEPQVFYEPGIDYIDGSAEGIEFKAMVKYYDRWLNSNGNTIDRASRVVVSFKNSDGEEVAAPIVTLARVNTTFKITKEIIQAHPELIVLEVPEAIMASEPVHELSILCARTEGLHGMLTGELTEGVDSPYDVTATARLINYDDEAASALLIVADYSEEGISKLLKFKNIELSANMTEIEEFSVTVPYDRETETVRAFLWDGISMRPLDNAVDASDLSIKDKYSPEVMELIPEYDTVKENVLRANDYRQSTWGPNQQVNGIHPAFWDTATYHTGNMEVYYTFGGEDYLNYSINWANGNGWMGNKNTDRFSEDSWTWGYNQNYDDYNNAVLFGDWQICFQTYLDLGLLTPDLSDLSRVEKVMGYQITKDEDAFWWWCDALYMVPPVMSKMYLTTGNEEYLDAMYRYYVYAKELLYDGEGGCGISDDENYTNLFFRDNSHVGEYVNGEKNMWARGNGWVFAGLSKVLSDMPADYKNRDFFVSLYNEMAEAIIDSQRRDDEGRGFWTQAMIANYPRGNGNEWGYETSGTAFFTYGLFWGMNSGMLDEDIYLEPALRGWKYLTEIALQENGKVGYVQGIGSGANTTPTQRSSDQPFGYGAFLLAGSEVSRWVGGVTENNAPYLMRKLWNGFAINGNNYYRDGNVGETGIRTDENGTLWFSEDALDALMDMSVFMPDDSLMLSYSGGAVTIPEDDRAEIDGELYVSAEFAAFVAGKHITDYDGVLVFSHKRDVFYDCDGNSVEYLKSLLQ